MSLANPRFIFSGEIYLGRLLQVLGSFAHAKSLVHRVITEGVEGYARGDFSFPLLKFEDPVSSFGVRDFYLPFDDEVHIIKWEIDFVVLHFFEIV